MTNTRNLSALLIVVISILAGGSFSMAGATMATDTTIVLDNVKSLIIKRTNDSVVVSCNGADSTMKYNYKQRVKRDSVAGPAKDWILASPFCTTSGRFEVITSGLQFGFVNAAGADGANFDMASSYELAWQNALSLKYYCKTAPFAFSIGVGIDWKNYKLKNQIRFYKDPESGVLTTGSYETGVEAKGSYIRVFSLGVPLMAEYRFGKNFRFSLGVIPNFNLRGSVATHYKKDGVDYESYFKDINHRKVTFDLYGCIGWGSFGVYAKYSPTSVLKAGYGPQFKSASVGLTLFF